jgi:hypothetical protein
MILFLLLGSRTSVASSPPTATASLLSNQLLLYPNMRSAAPDTANNSGGGLPRIANVMSGAAAAPASYLTTRGGQTTTGILRPTK